MRITDDQMDELFDEFLAEPDIADWSGEIGGQEYEDAKRLFRIAIRKALDIDRG